MVRAVRTVIALGMALGILAGCGGGANEEKVVASAGDIRVTLADFNDAYSKITPTNRPDISTLEAKRRFALGLLDKEILLVEGRKVGGISDPVVLQQIKVNFRNVVSQILYREEVEAKVEILGREVAELYEHRKVDVEASHILLSDEQTAQRVRQEITRGEISFADAAGKYSMDHNTQNRGGALGQIKWSRVMPEAHEAIFALEPGAISEPIVSEVGVHLVRVDRRLPQDLPPLEDLRVSLRTDLRRQKETERMREFLGELEGRAGLAWNDEGIEVLRQVVDEMLKLDVDTIPVPKQYIPEPTPEQSLVRLASFAGRDWTVGDYAAMMAMQPVPSRPVSNMPASAYKELIRSTQIDPEIIYEEALAKGLDKRAEAVDQDRRLREHILLEIVHGRFLQAADVTEEDARAVYDSALAVNPTALEIPERVDMLVLISTKEEVVREGLKRIRQGESEEAIIQELSEDFRTKFKGGRTGLVARANYVPQLEDVAFDPKRVGRGWSDAVVTESSTGAVKVLAHEDPRVSTFEEQKDLLTRKLVQARGEAAFEEWMQERRDSLGIEIHDDVLDLMGQPVS